MAMRKALIDKCEEVIDNQKVFVNQSEGLDLRTKNLFKDLIQFYSGDRSSQEIVMSQDSLHGTPSVSASFIPAISQKNINHNDSVG